MMLSHKPLGLAITMLLTACGGGGSGDSEAGKAVSSSPTAPVVHPDPKRRYPTSPSKRTRQQRGNSGYERKTCGAPFAARPSSTGGHLTHPDRGNRRKPDRCRAKQQGFRDNSNRGPRQERHNHTAKTASTATRWPAERPGDHDHAGIQGTCLYDMGSAARTYLSSATEPDVCSQRPQW